VLAILTTHPIQYQVPLWRVLAADGRVPFEVWFLTRHGADVTPDKEFGRDFAWDVDPLKGYPHRFLKVNENWDVNRFWGVRLAESLGPMIREKGVRAVWLQGWQVAAYWQAVRQVTAAGASVWLRGESNDMAPRPAWKRRLRRAVLGQLFRRVDHFLCIGSANRRMYEGMGVQGDRLHMAPYCVDNARFAAQAEEIRNSKFEIRNFWRIPGDAFCVMFCGKFIAKKRPMDLVAAVRRLGNSKFGIRIPKTAHLLFVGSGELSDVLRSQCEVVFDLENQNFHFRIPSSEFKARPRASFTGFLNQTEIPRAYAAADCLVLPSDHGETWGLVVNEAMACGLPCVVSDACGCAEDMVVPVDPALSYPCGDTDALAKSIAHTMGHHEALAARCRELVKGFDLGRTVDAVVRVWNHG